MLGKKLGLWTLSAPLKQYLMHGKQDVQWMGAVTLSRVDLRILSISGGHSKAQCK